MSEQDVGFNPADYLPLTPVAFEVLLALGEGMRHGYAIMREVEDRTVGRSLHPGTLYRALARLVDEGLLEELDPPADGGHVRRRYYGMTPLGRRVASAEAERLLAQLEVARARRFFGGTT
jgi:DNA-binding PadR family transcriptional regulator